MFTAMTNVKSGCSLLVAFGDKFSFICLYRHRQQRQCTRVIENSFDSNSRVSWIWANCIAINLRYMSFNIKIIIEQSSGAKRGNYIQSSPVAEKIWNISYTCTGQEFNQKFCPEPPSDHISQFTGFPKMKLGFILKTVDLYTIFINYLENSNVGGCRTNIYLGYKMEHIQAICISLISVLYLTAIHIFRG